MIMPPAKLINAVIEKINSSIGTPFFSCYVSDNRVTVEKFNNLILVQLHCVFQAVVGKKGLLLHSAYSPGLLPARQFKKKYTLMVL